MLDVPRELVAVMAGLYVVSDNFSPHRHAHVHTWCAANTVELVFLPTYGSWLNWIETEFSALRYFARGGIDHRSHASRTPPSLSTSDGATPEPSRRSTSQSTHRSGHGPITRPRLRDNPLAAAIRSAPPQVIR
jgi:hypothetical protein